MFPNKIEVNMGYLDLLFDLVSFGWKINTTHTGITAQTKLSLRRRTPLESYVCAFVRIWVPGSSTLLGTDSTSQDFDLSPLD